MLTLLRNYILQGQKLYLVKGYLSHIMLLNLRYNFIKPNAADYHNIIN